MRFHFGEEQGRIVGILAASADYSIFPEYYFGLTLILREPPPRQLAMQVPALAVLWFYMIYAPYYHLPTIIQYRRVLIVWIGVYLNCS